MPSRPASMASLLSAAEPGVRPGHGPERRDHLGQARQM